MLTQHPKSSCGGMEGVEVALKVSNEHHESKNAHTASWINNVAELRGCREAGNGNKRLRNRGSQTERQ